MPSEIENLRAENLRMRARLTELEGRPLAFAASVPDAWDLRRMGSMIVGMLLRADGRFVDIETLCSFLWSERRRPANPQKTLHAHIFSVRRKLAPFGVIITNRHNVGFAIKISKKSNG